MKGEFVLFAGQTTEKMKMRAEAQPFHIESLATHNHLLFNNLIYEHNLITSTLKEIEFSDPSGNPCSPIRGFFAVKDKVKYWIDEGIINDLPIRVGNQVEELLYREDVIIRPLNPTKFKIVPFHSFTMKQVIETIAPFNHSNPDAWTLLKLIAIASYVGRTYICIASNSSFGKSTTFDIIHSITDKCPVFVPRTVPGVLNQINGVGNLVFDEIHDCKGDVKKVIEEISLQVGGGKSVYINGALEAKKTKSKYNCSNQSITFLYNDLDHYKNPEKEYFEYTFSNNIAIDDRFLKLRLQGKLTEKFDRDFDIIAIAEANKNLYISLAKELAYLQELKLKNGYQRRFDDNSILQVKGRRKNILTEIAWVIDMYSDSQLEFDKYYTLLEKAVVDYRIMLGEQTTIIVEQEEVI